MDHILFMLPFGAAKSFFILLFFLSAVFLPASQNVGCVTPAELIIWQIYRFH